MPSSPLTLSLASPPPLLQVTEEQRWALLEFIAHLSTEDWEAMTVDLQCLGFIPQSVRGSWGRERRWKEGRVCSVFVNIRSVHLAPSLNTVIRPELSCPLTPVPTPTPLPPSGGSPSGGPCGRPCGHHGAAGGRGRSGQGQHRQGDGRAVRTRQEVPLPGRAGSRRGAAEEGDMTDSLHHLSSAP